jgi:[ribosomal protein S5]-alanine N-acetyltransferase
MIHLLTPWLVADDSSVIVGQKVVLRAPAHAHFSEWQALRKESRPFLEPWEPTWDDRDFSRSSYRDRVNQYRNMSDQDQAYAFFIFDEDNGKLCGAVTISNIRRSIAQMGTLGYWIGERFARRGLMTDALTVLIPYAFSELGLHRLEAACLPRNQASIGLLEKCGFTREGYAPSYLKIAGRWEDHLLFGKVNERRASDKVLS